MRPTASGAAAIGIAIATVCACGAAETASAPPAPGGPRNLLRGPDILGLLDLAILKEPNEGSTASFGAELAVGFPLIDALGIGLEIGGGIRPREIRPDAHATAGLFRRKLDLAALPPLSGALLLDYRYTQRERSLFALRPEGCLAITARDAVGASATFPLNSKVAGRGGGRERIQRFAPRGEVFWAARWAPEVGTEIGLGFILGDEDTPVLRGSVFWSMDDSFGLVPAVEASFRGQYFVGVAIALDFGGADRSLANRFPTDSPYSPFPLWSFGRIGAETKERP